MNSLRLRLLQGGLALGALLVSAVASADQGTIVLVSGQVVVGEVQQVVAGEYILVVLPSGEVKAIAWGQIGSFQVGGSATVSTGNPTAPTAGPPPAANPTPPPTYTPPPPPPPNYGYGYGAPPPPPPPPAPTFNPAWMLGVRVGSMTANGYVAGSGADATNVPIGAYAKSGWSFELDAGIHVSPAWTLYGLWEYGNLGKGDANANATDSSTMNTVGGGANVNSNPNGPIGFFFDAAVGYRWFRFQQPVIANDGAGNMLFAGNSDIVAGATVLRLGMGMSIVATPKFRIDPAVQLTFGSFRSISGGNFTTNPSEGGSHATYGFVVGGRWDL